MLPMKKVLAVLALALAAIALVACGGSSDNDTTATSPSGGGAAAGGGGGGGGGGGSSTIKLSADPSGALKYNTDSLSAKAGNVTIDFDNPASVSHDVSVESSSGQSLGTSDLVAQGKTTLDLSNLKPGTYTYFCTVPGHREGGMEGTLTVK
jgi:plastocyanin